MQYRYTVTFDAVEGCFTGETRDKLKKRLMEDTELLCGENVKVSIEDQFCINANKNASNMLMTIENTELPSGSSEYIASAKLLIQFLKNIQLNDDNVNNDFVTAMTTAINALLTKNNEAISEEEQEKNS